MFDNMLTNKYFCVAIIIALILLLYMYHTKQSCNIEGMSNVDLTPLAQELTEKPWAEQTNKSQYKEIGLFDKKADKFVKSKLKKNGYNYTKTLSRTDQRYKQEADKIPMIKHKYYKKKVTPVPLDDHPELGQCQPCKCDVSESEITSDSYYSDSDSE